MVDPGVRHFLLPMAFTCALIVSTSTIAMSADDLTPSSAYTHPQRLVPIDGARKLNIFCLGHGSPTVLLDAGTGGSTASWKSVQGDIATLTAVCSYDRAGYGFSDEATRTSDAKNAVDDLHRLVVSANLRMPLVLVGHSNGGIYATLYAKTYPNSVAGMVLIDPGFTGQQHFERYGLSPNKVDALVQANAHYVSMARNCVREAKAGVLAQASRSDSPCLDNPSHYDTILHEALNRQESMPKYQEANLSEFENTFVTIAGDSVNDRENPLEASEFGSMPIVVLTASRHPAPVTDFTEQDQVLFYAFWKHSHDNIASLSTDSESVVIPDSGHYIQRDQPALVIDYVSAVVSKVRAESGNAETLSGKR